LGDLSLGVHLNGNGGSATRAGGCRRVWQIVSIGAGVARRVVGRRLLPSVVGAHSVGRRLLPLAEPSVVGAPSPALYGAAKQSDHDLTNQTFEEEEEERISKPKPNLCTKEKKKIGRLFNDKRSTKLHKIAQKPQRNIVQSTQRTFHGRFSRPCDISFTLKK
jgi:hypothetical protein